jgi:hypothetical protein
MTALTSKLRPDSLKRGAGDLRATSISSAKGRLMAKGEDETMDRRPGHPAPIGKDKAKPSRGVGQPIRPEAPEAPAPQSTIPAMKAPHRENGDDESRQDGAIAKD